MSQELYRARTGRERDVQLGAGNTKLARQDVRAAQIVATYLLFILPCLELT
jgi:hypothetical protein